MSGATRYLEVSLGGLAPDDFDPSTFYRSQLQDTKTVQIARVGVGRADGGGTQLLLTGEATETMTLWRRWSDRKALIHAGAKCALWAPRAPLKKPPAGAKSAKKQSRPSFKHARKAAAPPRTMVEILDALGVEVLDLQSAFEDECRVEEANPVRAARAGNRRLRDARSSGRGRGDAAGRFLVIPRATVRAERRPLTIERAHWMVWARSRKGQHT